MQKNPSLAILATFLGSLTLVAPAHAATFAYTGTTSGAPTWNRPIEEPFSTDCVAVPQAFGCPSGLPAPGGLSTGTGLSLNGTATPYSVFQFAVDQSGKYSFGSDQAVANSTPWNGFIFLYSDGFNPLNPLANFVAANNNADIELTRSAINNIDLVTGKNYYFVTTGFLNTDFGKFNNRIQGPGTAFATPEPASMAGLLALGLGGAFSKSRKKKQAKPVA